MRKAPKISISIVSHGQMPLVDCLLKDIDRFCVALDVEVILTLNLNSEIALETTAFSYSVQVIRNVLPKGFGANHNQAFKKSNGEFFCVVNPDVRLKNDPFGPLLELLKLPDIGVVAPSVFSKNGHLEDSARPFPTLARILRRAYTGKHESFAPDQQSVFYPDWIGGMFMCVRKADYESLTGFDERYFLYYEDVELCGRMRLKNLRTAVCTQSKIIHDAQRSSHKKAKYFFWHANSMLRFLTSKTWRQLWLRGHL